MGKVKLIGLDMDGTLLNERQEISEENAKAIQQAQDKGIKVVVVTGRAYDETFPLLDAAGIVCPVLCVNGAEIRSDNGEILQTFPLPPDIYFQVDRMLREENLYYELYTNRGTYTDDLERMIEEICSALLIEGIGVDEPSLRKRLQERISRGELRPVQSYKELLRKEGMEIYKCLAVSADREKLDRARRRLREIGGLAVSASAGTNIEITSERATKGLALQAFARTHHIPLEETMAIGDSYNDLSMLTIVAFSVAMGNAGEEIKRACKFITLSNRENGVAYAIRSWAL